MCMCGCGYGRVGKHCVCVVGTEGITACMCVEVLAW